jgi:hypothetical protein
MCKKLAVIFPTAVVLPAMTVFEVPIGTNYAGRTVDQGGLPC